MNIIDNTLITFLNLEVDYFESKTVKEFINFESKKMYYLGPTGKIMIIIIINNKNNNNNNNFLFA